MDIRVPLFIFFIQIPQTLTDETLIAFPSSEIEVLAYSYNKLNSRFLEQDSVSNIGTP